jgi:hypothetical protein
MDTPSEMDPPSEHATPADPGIDWDYVNAHHRPVTLISRPAYEGWVLTLFGVILVGLIGGLGWAGYALSTVQAELRQLQVQITQLASHSASGQAVPEETARRLQAMDQRLHAVENGTRQTLPRATALERRPRERADQPQEPSPPQALPPAPQLPRNATHALRTPRDVQAHRDMLQQAATSQRVGAPVPDSFATWLEWHPEWELRWMSFQVSGQPPVYLYHITHKRDPGHRYTMYRESNSRTAQRRTPWQRVS